MTGDVEVHIFPADWRHHGHGGDPRYHNVCLHLTYFEGSIPEDELPSGALQVAMRPLLATDAAFSFEHVDVTSYPYAGRADLPPCRSVLANWPVDMKVRLLEAAGHERLARKARKFSDAIVERGLDQVLYEAMMSALGYHKNRQPFYELAVRFPVDRLRELAEGDPFRSYAILAGLSGLLPAEINESWDDETRQFVRHVWEIWWKERGRLPAAMNRSDWNLGGIRPLNHPLRRLMSAAHLFVCHADGMAILSNWAKGETDQLIARMERDIEPDIGHYWTHRAGLGGIKSRHPTALTGRDRIETMALNVVLPLLAAVTFDEKIVGKLLNQVPQEPLNSLTKQVVHYLFGPDCPSSLISTANRRQGLLQIFHDYCLHDRSQCSLCPLPGYLQRQVVAHLA